jgi:hypothetical protein
MDDAEIDAAYRAHYEIPEGEPSDLIEGGCCLGVYSDGWLAGRDYQRQQADPVAAPRAPAPADRVLAYLLERHQELAAGALWNGPHGACATCMVPYPCAVARALKEARTALALAEGE